MSLRSDIAKWNGKSKDEISSIYDRYANNDSLLLQLIECLDEPSVQKGATWIIKRHTERAGCLDTKTVEDILGNLPRVTHWESKLHLLQCLPHVSIPTTREKAVESFVRQCLVAENKFVRAWGYSGFYELARQYPAYREEAEQFMAMAMRDEPASVRARVRKLMSEGF